MRARLTIESNDHAQIVVTTPTKIITFQGVIQGWGWDVSPEENVDEMTLMPIDIGGPNPTFVVPT